MVKQLVQVVVWSILCAVVLWAILRKIFGKSPGFPGVAAGMVLAGLATFALGTGVAAAGLVNLWTVAAMAVAGVLVQAWTVDRLAPQANGTRMGLGAVALASLIQMAIVIAIGIMIHRLLVS